MITIQVTVRSYVGSHSYWDYRRSYWDQVSVNRNRQIDLVCLLSQLVGMPLCYYQSYWDWSKQAHALLSKLLGSA